MPNAGEPDHPAGGEGPMELKPVKKEYGHIWFEIVCFFLLNTCKVIKRGRFVEREAKGRYDKCRKMIE